MSYYKGGRGGGSGGYRGGSGYRGSRGGGESSWRGSRGGSFSSSRGSRYSSYPSPTYDSRSRSSYGGSAADRYSRGRDEPYHRYSQDVNDYSRDYGRGLSPEPPRKRARGDTSPSYMATRRSHERSFASDYSSGRSYFDKGGASTTAGGYIGDKGYTREVRERGGDFPFRKPAGYSSPRGGGGYRGRSGRGVRSRGFRSTSSFLRKRDSFAIRKRAALSSRSDYIRRLKQLRLRRRLRAARRAEKDSDEDAEQAEKDDEDDEEVEEVEEGSSGEEEVEEEEEEDESNEKEQAGEDENKGDAEEGASEVKEGESEEKKEGEEAADGESTKKEQPKPVKKKVVKKVKKVKVSAEKDESKTEEGEKETEKEKEENEEESDKPMLTDFLGQPFIKLKCPHCHHLCVTFKEYSKHLDTRKHQKAMTELFTKLRKTLVNMRMEQRKKQRQIDDEMKTKNMHLKTFFCAICKLNYRSLKSQHLFSSAHRKMSEFLIPFCKVCRVWFKSAWSYESHLCELSHIKRKARMEKLARPPMSKDDGDMLDPSSFMILDSVGSGDDSDVEKSEDESGEKKEAKDENDKEEKSEKDSSAGEPKKRKRSEIKLGAEFCKMVEVYYCDLCKIYLPRLDDKEKALSTHCRSRTHLQRYVRLNNARKDDATLRRKAVRLHKERQKLKEKKEKEETSVKEEEEVAKPADEEQMEVTEKPVEEQTEEANGAEVKEEAVESPAKKNNEEDEEKMWSEVDKDLSDLLHDGDEPHDDEEDSRKERYDRFKQSDKPDKNSSVETDVKPNGDLPPAEKKKVSTDNEEK